MNWEPYLVKRNPYVSREIERSQKSQDTADAEAVLTTAP